ncbi:MAG: 50S ribosomal protein L21 [Candidatus Woykebacteria bacterium RIFCSPHIGHO2_12_FULL_43_10]|uniref:Large ribosomal subunit protein bL21 n=2 Tax=Candidatus Woykeibacteriota TaxID=1817899 RepID=A0A1G1WVV4_9BACT|nr:MAG: 50S ribosomal protein L21 [Candidatus Woykebacteria bacterium RIFCSPHIGHO2_02_FULL_43_16b]OGY29416.1 MAG: 50S ribosomal protein L21 [Candidatus Woykebacteria bacterium RIFCSPHIGHO2_12_FULL_43_10]OGY31287.1 MAG: 50S ribosomal protein L21 [Candidatus Woykebacteria bacterium RIFCSPLOWO2_01_FULL_43_14]
MKYAVIKTGGKQYRVSEGETLDVEKLPIESGKEVVFEDVLLVKDGDCVLVGTPRVDKASVKAAVLDTYKDKKIRVLKYKAKSHYKRVLGHRQLLTKVRIGEITFEKESVKA